MMGNRARLFSNDWKSAPRRRPRALVLGCHCDAGLVCQRELNRAGFEVFGTDPRPAPRWARSRFSQGDFAVAASTDEEFAGQLLDLLRDLRPDVVLPVDTRHARVAVLARAAFPEGLAAALPDAEAFQAACDKVRCMRECASVGIATPRTYSLEEAESRLSGGGPDPLVVKPGVDAGGATDVSYVRSGAELREAMARCVERHGRCLIQEYVPGDVHMATLLFDRGRLLTSLTVRKTLCWPPSGGMMVTGECTGEPEPVTAALPFFARWSWTGPAEAEWIRDTRDGSYKLIEINPRIHAYLRFVVRCGIPLPVMAARLAMGERLGGGTDSAHPVGAPHVNPVLLSRLMRYERRQGRSAAAVLKKARGLGGVLWDMMSDPVPLGALLVESLFRGFSRATRGRPRPGPADTTRTRGTSDGSRIGSGIGWPPTRRRRRR